jgi:hypothetical protein
MGNGEWNRRAERLGFKAFSPEELANKAYRLYERFRPEIPKGVEGWGAKGVLDLGVIEGLGK